MIKISTAAIEQIRISLDSQTDTAPIRVAVKTLDDGSFHYAMGFDAQRLPGDNFVNIEEVHLVVSAASKDLAEGMTIDYVELEPGSFEFIFLNPNDPTYVPPKP